MKATGKVLRGGPAEGFRTAADTELITGPGCPAR